MSTPCTKSHLPYYALGSNSLTGYIHEKKCAKAHSN